MENNKFKVSSWNEWDPLKHVIVGKADNCHIPPPEPALDAKVPENSDMKGHWGKRPQETILLILLQEVNLAVCHLEMFF